MPKYKQIPANEIIIKREERQRKHLGDIGILADSIKRLGVINPITITKDFILIAGERRLAACKILDETFSVPCRFYEDLDEVTKQLIELEENVKREELNWIDKTLSIKKIHLLRSNTDPEWTIAQTAEVIGLDPGHVSSSCIVADRLLAGDEKILRAEGLRQAKNYLERETGRAIDNELNNLLETERGEPTRVSINEKGEAETIPVEPQEERASIEQGDFLQWVKTYSGRRFNLIHCDFPYGIGHDNSEQGGTATGRYEGYEDSKDTYFHLIESLCENLEKVMTPSGHVMFWFSMNYYQETIECITKESDLVLSMPQPLIWHKSDGKGIVSDVNRRPRNVYETCLLFARGDRKIITPVDNCYSCPTNKSNALHVSEKPEPMLRHFFRMFVDSYSEILDPTCGAGSAIRAGYSLGAKRGLGLELSGEFAQEAKAQLLRSKNLDSLSSLIGD